MIVFALGLSNVFFFRNDFHSDVQALEKICKLLHLVPLGRNEHSVGEVGSKFTKSSVVLEQALKHGQYTMPAN